MGRRAARVRPQSPATEPRPGSTSTPQLTYCGPPSRRSSPSVPGHSAPTRVVVPLRTHPQRDAELLEFALGPQPQRPDQGRCLPPNSPTAGRRAAEVCPRSTAKCPDHGRCSSPYPPTAGRRAAGVRPRSPATTPRLGSSSTPQPTYCGPPSRRSLPSVPGHSALTRVVVPLCTHPLRAAEPQQFALGPRPQRPDQGRRLPPNSPTAGRRVAEVCPRSTAKCPDHGRCSSPYPPTAGRRAAGVRPRSPATEPRLGSSSTPQLTYCGPPSRRSLPSVSGHSALNRVVVPLCTHPLRAAEPQKFAHGPRPQRSGQGRRLPPNSPTAGRRAAEVCPSRPQCPDHGRCSSPYPPTAGRRAAGVRPRSPATEPRRGSSSTPQLTYCGPPSRRSLPLVPGLSAPTRVVVPLRTHPLRAAELHEFALGPRPQRPD